MSNTRHAKASGEIRQDRFMSDPAFAEQRGLIGNLVAERVSLLVSERKRSLILFLQAESLKPGGIKRVAREIVDMFPERLGTRTMHKNGIHPGGKYSGEIAREIMLELGMVLRCEAETLLDDEESSSFKRFKASEASISMERCLELCRERAAGLDEFLLNLCLNPRVTFADPKAGRQTDDVELNNLLNAFPDDEGQPVEEAKVSYFKDVVSALYEYQGRKQNAFRNQFVETEVTRQVFECMDFAQESRGLVVINGHSRIGKSTSAAAWCEMNSGIARYVSLTDASDEAAFYRPIARALGVTSSYGRKACEMRDRIADMLQRSGLMLVLDEAHYAWPQFLRPTALPRRVNWILTALCNYKIPVVLVTTPQFVNTQKRVEKHTGWTSEQFKGRMKRFRSLPEKLDTKDLSAIARFYLPEADKATLLLLVGYAQASATYISAIVNVVDEARFEAKLQGRDKLTFEDIDKAIKGAVRVSNDDLIEAYAESTPRKDRRGKPLAQPVSAPLQASCNDDEPALARSGGRLGTVQDRAGGSRLFKAHEAALVEH